jgi:raffinose/stachyose/melibiose transport system permease protein
MLGCYALLLPTLGLLGVFTFVPMLWAFTTSLFEYEVGGDAQWVGLANYAEFFTDDPTFLISFRNMFFLTAFAVGVRLVVPLVVAKLIISLPSERARHVYRIAFLAPIVVPLVAVQLIWRGLIYSQEGLLNQVLGLTGLESLQHGWLSEPGTALFAIACIGFPFVGGFEVLIYYAGLAAIPESVNDSARMDGATGVKKFLAIDVPMVLSQIRLIVALTVIAGIQGFELILILTRGQPGFNTMVPGLWMYFNAFSFQRMGYACAIGVILFIVIAILTTLNLKYLRGTEES